MKKYFGKLLFKAGDKLHSLGFKVKQLGRDIHNA